MHRQNPLLVTLPNASEATLDDALAHWRGRGQGPDVEIRVIARTEIAGIEREIDRRRALGLWRSGAYPGPSTWIAR